MMTLSQLIHMAATDPDFRAALAADPETALRERDLQVSREIVRALYGLRHVLGQSSRSLSALLPSHIIASAWGQPVDIPSAVPGHAAVETQ
jgi:hypothetical protein